MPDQSLLGPSKTKIIHLLAGKPRTAHDIATNLHMQPSAARKHLEQLASLGLAGKSFQKSNIGRPKKFYSLTDNGREMFPRQYDAILNRLVEKLVQVEGPSYAESLMKRVATDISDRMNGPGLKGEGRENHALAELNQWGFEASIRRNEEGLTVISRNCPLYKTAVAHGEIICRGIHEELLKASLSARNVKRSDWIVSGDTYCKHTISK